MRYTRLYEWPFVGSEGKAKEFFTKSKAHWQSFPLIEDASICLCEVSSRWCCLVFVDSDDYRDDSIEKTNKIKEFLKAAGCPEEMETEDANWDGQMSLDTIDRSLSCAKVRVVDRIIRRAHFAAK